MSEVAVTTQEFKTLTEQMQTLAQAVYGGQQKMGLFETQQRKLRVEFQKNPIINIARSLGNFGKAVSNVTKIVANNSTMTREQRVAHVKQMTVLQKATAGVLQFSGMWTLTNKVLLVSNNRLTRLATRLFALLSIFAIIGFALATFSIALDGANSPILTLTEGMGPLHDAMQGLVLVITGGGDEEGLAAGFDILAASILAAGVSLAVFSAPVAIVIGAIVAAVGVFRLFKAETDSTFVSLLAGVGTFAAFTGAVLVLKLMFTNLLGTTATAVAGSVGAVMLGVGLVIGGFAAVIAYAMGVGEGIKGVVLGIVGAVLIGVGLVVAGVALPLAAIIAVGALIVATVVRYREEIWNGIVRAWNGLLSLGKAVGNFFLIGLAFIGRIAALLIGVVLGLVGGIVGAIMGLVSSFITDFIYGGTSLLDWFISLPGKMWDGAKAGFAMVFNGIIGLYNDFAAGMQFDIPDWVPKIGGQVFELPRIPMLAKGGIVSKPTIAMIGEDGPEAVVPLSQKNNPQGIGLGGGDVTININVAGVTDRTDKKQLAREIGDLLRGEMTRSGRSFGNRRSAV